MESCNRSEYTCFCNELEEISTLLKLDLLLVSESLSAEMQKSIAKDEVSLMDKSSNKFSNFCKALERLKEAVEAYEKSPSDLIRDAVIQRFEFTFELAWKTAREFLFTQGFVDLNSPRAVLRQAFSYGLIKVDDVWIEILNDRDLTSHLYDEKIADEYFAI